MLNFIFSVLTKESTQPHSCIKMQGILHQFAAPPCILSPPSKGIFLPCRSVSKGTDKGRESPSHGCGPFFRCGIFGRSLSRQGCGVPGVAPGILSPGIRGRCLIRFPLSRPPSCSPQGPRRSAGRPLCVSSGFFLSVGMRVSGICDPRSLRPPSTGPLQQLQEGTQGPRPAPLVSMPFPLHASRLRGCCAAFRSAAERVPKVGQGRPFFLDRVPKVGQVRTPAACVFPLLVVPSARITSGPVRIVPKSAPMRVAVQGAVCQV